MSGKAHSLCDREYLRTLDTKTLRTLLRNTVRSRDELHEYVVAMTEVLTERNLGENDGQEG